MVTRVIGSLCLALTTAAPPASAQSGGDGEWTVTNLHPEGAGASGASATTATQQVGWVGPYGYTPHASLWNGNAQSWVDLVPGFSYATATNGTQQVGYIWISGWNLYFARLWSGTPESWIDLTPTGATESLALAMTDTHQAGAAKIKINPIHSFWHAGLWQGTKESWVDLHPTGMTYGDSSKLYAVFGSQQAGYFAADGVPQHASLWSGTKASWVDLHPVQAGASESLVLAMTATQQAGHATIGGVQHACLWNGTAASWVDLHPTGSAGSSRVNGAAGSFQAGFATIGGQQRALLWNGTPTSWEDLSFALPGAWGSAHAEGIHIDATTIYVVGSGYNNLTKREEALLWTRPIAPPCPADCDASGGLTIDDFICFQTLYATGDPKADCDQSGGLDIDDFICFQTLFAIGC